MKTTSDKLRVGFIGLGSQGGPMARRIIEAGHPVTLWARRPGPLEPFADTAGVDQLRLADVISHGSGNSFALERVASADGTLARIGEHAGHLLRKDVKLIAGLAATAPARGERGTSEPVDAGHGHGGHGATMLAAADAALALMNVSR
jgi:3-hydroxyisobutyrate dehydrogenase